MTAPPGTMHPLLRRVRYAPGRSLLLLRRAALLRQDRLIPFLRPPWGEEELRAGQGWRPEHPRAADEQLSAAEREFMGVLGFDGLAVATSSGRTALELALRALRRERPERSEVVIPAYSCRGLLEGVVRAGLTPVYADVGEDLNPTAESVRPLLGRRTLAVVLVHLGGRRNLDDRAICAMTEEAGAAPIEDLCQSLGGQTEGLHWGASAPLLIYSFGLGKTLGATAGGMLVARRAVEAVRLEADSLGTEDPSLVQERFRYVLGIYQRTGLRLLGERPVPPLAAFESAADFKRMSSLDARLLRLQLPRLGSILDARARNAAALRARLAGVPGLRVVGDGSPNIWTKFTVVADTGDAARSMTRALHALGVETEAMYTPLHLRECGRDYGGRSLAVTEQLWPRVFNLPVRPSLTGRQLDYVAEAVRRVAA